MDRNETEVERLKEENRILREENRSLQEEIARLKGNKRPPGRPPNPLKPKKQPAQRGRPKTFNDEKNLEYFKMMESIPLGNSDRPLKGKKMISTLINSFEPFIKESNPGISNHRLESLKKDMIKEAHTRYKGAKDSVRKKKRQNHQ